MYKLLGPCLVTMVGVRASSCCFASCNLLSFCSCGSNSFPCE
jgi:hypothetical protein